LFNRFHAFIDETFWTPRFSRRCHDRIDPAAFQFSAPRSRLLACQDQGRPDVRRAPWTIRQCQLSTAHQTPAHRRNRRRAKGLSVTFDRHPPACMAKARPPARRGDVGKAGVAIIRRDMKILFDWHPARQDESA
jgi:hypothetical protein